MTAQELGQQVPEADEDEVDAVKPQQMYCPDCRQLHVACTLMPCFPDTAWAWFTCGDMRYSFPESQGRLGGRQYSKIEVRTLTMVVGCPGCGRDAKAGAIVEDPDDGAGTQLMRYICYRCGEVGTFQVAPRVAPRQKRRWLPAWLSR